MNDNERWADCAGYQGLYRVSSRGRVFNVTRLKLLTGTITVDGYHQVTLTFPGKGRRSHLVHALVLKTFVGPRPDGYVCDHVSANRLENTVENLEWVTHRENVLRAAGAGRLRTNPARGEDHYFSKLTKEQVQTIRTRHKDGTSMKELARTYRVTSAAIWKVVQRHTWKHIP